MVDHLDCGFSARFVVSLTQWSGPGIAFYPNISIKDSLQRSFSLGSPWPCTSLSSIVDITNNQLYDRDYLLLISLNQLLTPEQMNSLSVRLAPHVSPPFTLSVRKQWFIWIVSHNVQLPIVMPQNRYYEVCDELLQSE